MSRRRTGPIAVAAAMAGLAFCLPSAGSETLRCGNRLVDVGDTQDKVRALCGEPESIETRTVLRRPSYWRHGRRVYYGEGVVDVAAELWTYNFGPNRFMRRIRFVDGRVEEIESLGYGHNKEEEKKP